MKVNRDVVIRAGLIGAAAAFVLALLMRIPFLNCLVCWIGPVLSLAIGALYVHLASQEGAVVEIGEGAVGGALTGAIASGVNALIAGIMNLIFGTVGAATEFLGEGEALPALTTAGATIGGVLIGIITSVIAGAILGALGGVIYAAIKKQ